MRTVPAHETTVRVLGLPVRFSSDSSAVLDVVESAFPAWRTAGTRTATADPLVTVTITLQPGGGDDRVRLRHRLLDRHRVLLAGGGNLAVIDPPARAAAAWVTPAFVRDAQHFRYTLVEAITMALITPLDRQPFHAACLVRNNAAVLITGPSGVGKSSLAYAAIRRIPGIEVLAEDAVYLQSAGGLRVWGLPGFVHLPEDAARMFPELQHASPVLMANGKTKIAIDLRETGAAARRPFVDRASVCILERGSGKPCLTPIDAGALPGMLMERLEEGFDRFRDTIEEPLRLLARNGGWLMRVTPEPAEALPWLDRILSEVEAAAERDGGARV